MYICEHYENCKDRAELEEEYCNVADKEGFIMNPDGSIPFECSLGEVREVVYWEEKKDEILS
jgi:hypothetical protein